jgi:hypothetical protein
MQKIILINEVINSNSLIGINEQLDIYRNKLANSKIEEQDLYISEIEKYKKLYFKAKAEEGFYNDFDDFLKHSKLSLNIMFDYLYKKDNSIRLKLDGTKMLINFCYELITENNKKIPEQNKKEKTDDLETPDWSKGIPSGLLLLLKNEEQITPVKKNVFEDDDDDDDDFNPYFPNSKQNKLKEANKAYISLIQFLIKALEDNTELIWSWQ